MSSEYNDCKCCGPKLYIKGYFHLNSRKDCGCTSYLIKDKEYFTVITTSCCTHGPNGQPYSVSTTICANHITTSYSEMP